MFRIVATLLFATAVAVFALQNGQAVEVRFFSARAAVSLALVILGALLAGAAAAGLAGWVRQLRLRRRLAEAAERIRRLEVDLALARRGKTPPEGGQTSS